MIPVGNIFNGVADEILKEANGELPFDLFNRLSQLAELDLIDWLSGDIRGPNPPEPYTTQKDRDWLTPFIKKFPTHAVNGAITRPSDFYGTENIYLLGDYNEQTDCSNEDAVKSDCNIPVSVLDGDQYYARCNTYIKGLKPSFKKPIAKMVGNTFEFLPSDCGSLVLEYYRYPKFAQIVSMHDAQYNEDFIDVNASTNYEWDLKASGILIYFIVDRFANRTSNKSMKESNMVTAKTPKG